MVFFVLNVAQAYVAKAAEATGKERVVKELFESVAARAAGGWQSAGSKFDFEVFALPGGSFIAVALWCWSLAMMMVKSSTESVGVSSGMGITPTQRGVGVRRLSTRGFWGRRAWPLAGAARPASGAPRRA